MQTTALIDTLKRELKRQRKTYRDVATTLGLSEASIRRLFFERSFKLDRLDKICGMLNMEISDLVRLMESETQLTSSLTLAQEQELVSDIRLVLIAHLLMIKWTFDEIVQTYEISETEGIQLLAQLDRMKFLQLLPGNRVKLLISPIFKWIDHGPIQRFFEDKVQTEFFKSGFTGEDEFRFFVSGMLTRDSRLDLIRRLQLVADEFSQKSLDDTNVPLSEKKGTSLSIATRPWRVKVFESMRREEVSK
jgi:DNA-binding Xre family transcriptional regulator